MPVQIQNIYLLVPVYLAVECYQTSFSSSSRPLFPRPSWPLIPKKHLDYHFHLYHVKHVKENL